MSATCSSIKTECDAERTTRALTSLGSHSMYFERARLNFIWSISLPCILLKRLEKSLWMLSHMSWPLWWRCRQRDSKMHRSSSGQVLLSEGGTSSPR